MGLYELLEGCTGVEDATAVRRSDVQRRVMPHERALSYIRFHVDAYGCPTPESEIADLLKEFDMTDAEIDELIAGMVARGDIKFVTQRNVADGYVPAPGA